MKNLLAVFAALSLFACKPTVNDSASTSDASNAHGNKHHFDLSVGPPHDMATKPQDLATAPHDLATAPRDLATAPRDLATAVHDLATAVVHDLATAVVHDLATAPHDLATVVPPPGNIDMCQGLLTDKLAHPMTTLAKPALGAVVTDAEFGTKIRRITQSSATSGDAAIIPLYSTVPAWNADESKLLLFDISGHHKLYDGKTYQFIRNLDELNPPDIEQIYWHGTDPDILLLAEGKSLIRYHVSTATKETLATFSFCTANATGGSDPMFTSFDSNRIGLKCADQVFIYDIPSKTVLGRQTLTENPAQISASGNYGYLSDSGRVTDPALNVLRTLDLREPYGHASLGLTASGADVWNGQAFDNGPNGDSDIGSLVVFNLADGTSKTIIGPKTGYPYPPDGHISAMALRQPGKVVVSTFGNTTGAGLLDMEVLIADNTSGKVCRAGRHRAWGKNNTHLQTPYWAEAHAVPSPSGSRIAFASDWMNGTTVDTYVLELPSYTPATP
jgi:hypothetical protein